MRISTSALALSALAISQVVLCHDSCDFGEGLSEISNLKVAGQVFGSTDIVIATPHHTIFVPNDKAFAALLTQLRITAQMLLSDPKYNNLIIGILSNHVLAPEQWYTAETLVGNKTISTQLGSLGKASYPLTFSQPTGSKVVNVRALNSTASVVGVPKIVCDRQVFEVDEVLLPGPAEEKDTDDDAHAAGPGQAASASQEAAAAPASAASLATMGFLVFSGCLALVSFTFL